MSPSFWNVPTLVSARRLGVRFELDLRDNVQRTLYFTGSYERPYVRLLREALRPGDVFVDIGAHIGIHTFSMARQLSRFRAGTVIAFEPAADLVSRLQETIRVNRIDNVDVVALSLGSSEGKRDLRADPERFDLADAAVRSFYGPGPIYATVASQTFDAWMSTSSVPRIDVVKIDVEGAELEVLTGMREALDRHRPRIVGIEIRPYLLKQAGVQPGAIEAFLGSFGYTPVATKDLEGNFVFSREFGQQVEV